MYFEYNGKKKNCILLDANNRVRTKILMALYPVIKWPLKPKEHVEKQKEKHQSHYFQ